MQIKIKETGEIKELNIYSNGINYIADFIGNTGAFIDGQFVVDDEVYTTDAANFAWWEKAVNAHQELEDRIVELKLEHGSEAVYQVVQNSGCDDLEINAGMVNDALDVAFTEVDDV